VTAATGSLTLTAGAAQSINAFVLAGSAAVGAGKTGVGLSGSGVLSENKIAETIAAYINADTNTLVTAHGLSAASIAVSASDSSTIAAKAGAASLAAAFGGSVGVAISIGVSLARNAISNTVEAYISNLANAANTLNASTGAITLSATESASITALSAAASLAVGFGSTGGFAASGAGAQAENVILTKPTAHLDASVVKGAAAVGLTATDSSSITARILAASVAVGVGGTAGVGLSIGASLADNLIGYATSSSAKTPGEARAYVLNSTVTAGGALTITASDSATIDAKVLAGSVAVSGGTVGVGLAGAVTRATN
jgi:hypothetical protein